MILSNLCLVSGIYSYFLLQNKITKIDWLFAIKSAVIWKQHIPLRVKLKKIYRVGFILIIVQFQQQNAIKTLIIFRDSLEISEFKQLMRQIRWHNEYK